MDGYTGGAAMQRPKTTQFEDSVGDLAAETSSMSFYKPPSTTGGSQSRRRQSIQHGRVYKTAAPSVDDVNHNASPQRSNDGVIRGYQIVKNHMAASTGEMRPMTGFQVQKLKCGALRSATAPAGSPPKLPPLPTMALTFEDFYKMAKKRAVKKSTENRQAMSRSMSSPMNSQWSEPRGLYSQPQSAEEMEWAADILGNVETEAEEEFPDYQREGSKDTSQQDSRSSRRGSKIKAVEQEELGSASQQLAAAMSTESVTIEKKRVQRDTRDESSTISAAYIQSLRAMMDGDGDFGSLEDTGVWTPRTLTAQAAMGGSIQNRLAGSFTADEVKRMKVAFMRFKATEGMEIHKEELPQTLLFLGYLKVHNQACENLADSITTYAMLDWEEYCDFVTKFAAYEREEFQKEFFAMDEDGSGQLSVEELGHVIKNCGCTPFRETVNEAMAVVDFDGSGEINFDEFVHFMAVYRVTEGFTRKDVKKFRKLFDRVASVTQPGGPKEIKPDQLADTMVHMFGPQSIKLAMKLARRFASGDHSCPKADLERKSVVLAPPPTEGIGASAQWDDMPPEERPSLPFPEFLLWCRRLREAEIVEFRKHFKAVDEDNSGFLGPDELKKVITSIGYMPLTEIMDEVLGKVDENGDGELDFEEFVNLLVVFRQTDGFTEREMAEFEEVFDMFKEQNEHKDEVVNCLHLMDLLRTMGYVTNLDIVRKFIKQVDFDSSNTLDMGEFIRLMRMNREIELQQALEAFENQSEDHINLGHRKVSRVLKNLTYKPTDKAFLQAMRDGGVTEFVAKPVIEEGQTEPSAQACLTEAGEMNFDIFVKVLDSVRKACMEVRRKNASYSDEEVDKYRTAFEVYDEDSSGDIERAELTKLLQDLGIPMGSKQDQQDMLSKLDVARDQARAAGVDDKFIGKKGDPGITFHVMLFLLRMISTASERAEVEREKKITDKTGFTPKEAAEFREIFLYWTARAAALESGNEAVEEAAAVLSSSGVAATADPNSQLLTQDGMKRIARSLGLVMSPADREELDKRLQAGPHDELNLGKYGFFEFLLFMRWMMNNDFAHINASLAAAAAAQAEAADAADD